MHGRREGIVTKVAEVSVDAAMAVVEYFLQFMEWQVEWNSGGLGRGGGGWGSQDNAGDRRTLRIPTPSSPPQ